MWGTQVSPFWSHIDAKTVVRSSFIIKKKHVGIEVLFLEGEISMMLYYEERQEVRASAR